MTAELRAINATPAVGPYREMWAAIVHVDNGEALLAMEVDGKFLPIIGRSWEEMEAWIKNIKPFLDANDGEDISLRCYRTYDFVDWIRKS